VSLHNGYLIALGALCALAFSLMIRAQIRQHRASGDRRFAGPAGTVQYLWAMVPIAILATIGGALIETPKTHPPVAPRKIELAVVLPVSHPVTLATVNRLAVERVRTPRTDGKVER